MSSDLVAFLKARLDEDERAVRDLIGAARRIDREPDFYGVGGPAALALWQRFSPVRVLAEVAAKRSAIEEYEGVVEEEAEANYDPDCQGQAMVSSLRGVLEALASVYPDHPDYQEWRP